MCISFSISSSERSTTTLPPRNAKLVASEVPSSLLYSLSDSVSHMYCTRGRVSCRSETPRENIRLYVRIGGAAALSTPGSGLIINIKIDRCHASRRAWACAIRHTHRQKTGRCRLYRRNRQHQRRLAPARARRHRRYGSKEHRTGRGVRSAAVASAAVAVLSLDVLEVDADLGPQVLGKRLHGDVWAGVRDGGSRLSRRAQRGEGREGGVWIEGGAAPCPARPPHCRPPGEGCAAARR